MSQYITVQDLVALASSMQKYFVITIKTNTTISLPSFSA